MWPCNALLALAAASIVSPQQGLLLVRAAQFWAPGSPKDQPPSYAWSPGIAFADENADGDEGPTRVAPTSDMSAPVGERIRSQAMATYDLDAMSPFAGASGEDDHYQYQPQQQQQQQQQHQGGIMWWSNRIIVPSAKLAFCYIPKNACDRMTSLFNQINAVAVDQGFQGSTPYKMHVEWSQITKKNGWKFAYFLRDPLARYASAWGSKCVPNTYGDIERNGEDCGGSVLWQQVPMSEMLQSFQKRVEEDGTRGQLYNNEHWLTQTTILRRCGWDKFNPDVADFIGDLSQDDVHEQVQRMLEMVHVPASGKLAEKFFPQRRVSGHQSHAHGNLWQFYNNRSIEEAVQQLYEEDYRVLRLPKRNYSSLD